MFAGTEEGARQLLSDIRTGDARAKTQALKPTSADYKAVFSDDEVANAEAGYAKVWGDPNVVMSAEPEQTELRLWKATSEELQQGASAARAFPGGYKQLVGKLKPGLTLYSWKYVKPGATAGMAYDGLVFVNDHWAWFPKPYRAIRGRLGE
jgi:hypothetical protein